MNYKTGCAILGVLAFVTAQNALSAEMPTLRYGRAGGITNLPLIVAQNEGFFAKEGVQLEVIKNAITGPDNDAEAAKKGYDPRIERGGLADMTPLNAGFLIQAVLNGSDAVAVGVQSANPVHTLIARPEIKTYADVKGKVVTLPYDWEADTVGARALLAQHGVGPNDYKFQAMGFGAARLECMKKGQCPIIALPQPVDILALKAGLGFHQLGRVYEAGPIVFEVEIVRREWAKTHKDIIVRYLRAEADAMRFIHDPKNRDEVAKTIGEITGQPPDVVNQIAATYVDPKLHVLPNEAELDMASFNNLLRFEKLSGNYDKPFPPAERFVDLSYAKAAGIR